MHQKAARYKYDDGSGHKQYQAYPVTDLPSDQLAAAKEYARSQPNSRTNRFYHGHSFLHVRSPLSEPHALVDAVWIKWNFFLSNPG